MATIPVDLPSQAVAALGLPGDELAREMRIAAAICWYGRSELSQEQAAKVAGLDRSEFLRACGRAGVNVFQPVPEECALEV
jgi:hypothetical protein